MVALYKRDSNAWWVCGRTLWLHRWTWRQTVYYWCSVVLGRPFTDRWIHRVMPTWF